MVLTSHWLFDQTYSLHGSLQSTENYKDIKRKYAKTAFLQSLTIDQAAIFEFHEKHYVRIDRMPTEKYLQLRQF